MFKNVKKSLKSALTAKYLITEEKQDSKALFESEFTNHNPYGSNRVSRTRREI